MDNEIGKRLGNLFTIKGIKNQEFASKINVGKTTVSNWTTVTTGIPLKHIYAIKKEYPDVNLNWLISGIGSPLLDVNGNENVIPDESTKLQEKWSECVRLEAQVDLLKTLLKSREAECRELAYKIKKLRPPNNT